MMISEFQLADRTVGKGFPMLLRVPSAGTHATQSALGGAS
eukprot:CAMPEP_0174722674 /NCGR_PEP_ID=MMETSP1094-20130205/39010_1 /TAXON_ID=156173 /ORGANISM="Chrysochromulina brevifilum, Strain UTEX LB 985" /LENGTH=39 /DNA_ID= /DNA_START= /DNA_END= /DNA_ORIENTATION=